MGTSMKDAGFTSGAEVKFEHKDGTPLKLIVNSPVEVGAKLLDLNIKDNFTVLQVKNLIAETTGLKKGSMIMARGKMGERVPEDAKLDESKLVVDCGYKDGDEIAF